MPTFELSFTYSSLLCVLVVSLPVCPYGLYPIPLSFPFEPRSIIFASADEIFIVFSDSSIFTGSTWSAAVPLPN